MSASVTNVTTIPVAKNVIVATRLAGESIALPLRPLPDVQPPAIFVPETDQHAAGEQDGDDQQRPARAAERVRQPAVAVEVQGRRR